MPPLALLCPIRQEVVLQSCPDEGVDGLLNAIPIGAVVAQHQPVDGRTAVHLNGKNSLRISGMRNMEEERDKADRSSVFSRSIPFMGCRRNADCAQKQANFLQISHNGRNFVKL